MLTTSTSPLQEKNNFTSQFVIIISHYRFTHEIIGKNIGIFANTIFG